MRELLIAPKDAGQRLDKYLKKILPLAGSSFLYKMLRKKNITLNEKKAEGNELLAAGDCVRVFFSDETYAKFSGAGDTGTIRPSAAALSVEAASRQERAVRAYQEMKGVRILYENEALLFLDKPVGILSQSDKSGALSLNDWVYGCALAKGHSAAGDGFIPSVCNRLDRNTSGIVMAAYTYAGSRFLSELMRRHALRKYYHACAEGHIAANGELRGYLVKEEKTNTVSIISAEDAARTHTSDRRQGTATNGAYVHTKYRVLFSERGYTHLEVELITGKPHQIRAHLASIGHPLAGDLKYGGHPYHGQRVQQLRAVRVEFPCFLEDTFHMSGRVIEC